MNKLNSIISSRFYLLLFLIIICRTGLQSQNATPLTIDPSARIIPASPNAASLGKYGSFPVSNYTGTPSISIPIYDLKGAGLSLPISLSYHASGIKVDEVASDVGLGWSLNAGGVITRTVKGLPDDDIGGGGLLNDNSIPQKLDYNSLTTNQNNQDYLARLANGNVDSEPDEFSFNFNGHTGKFVIDRSKTVRIIPYQDLKIVPNFNITNQVNTWTVTTPEGIQYFFGESTASRELTNPDITKCTSDAISQFVSSWFLTRIVNPNTQESINLSYTSHLMSYIAGVTQTIDFGLYEDDKVQDASLSGYSQACFCGNQPFKLNNKTLITCQSNRNLVAAQLNEISSLFYKAKFNYDTIRKDLPSGVKVNSVDIVSLSTSNILKHFVLNYDYFYADSTTNNQPAQTDLNYRLKLTTVQESNVGINIPPYSFNYNENGGYNLPARLSYNQDHWGYKNAALNTTLLPTLFGSSKMPMFPGANRQPDPERLKAGTLSQIIFPTGGRTQFDYEANYCDGEAPTSIYERVRSAEWEKNQTQRIPTTLRCDKNAIQRVATFTVPNTGVEALITFTTSNSANPPDVTAHQSPERLTITGPVHFDMYGNSTTSYYSASLNNSIDSLWMHFDTGQYVMTLWVDTSIIKDPIGIAYLYWDQNLGVQKNQTIAGFLAGGLRIKNISTYDGVNPTPIIKRFSYQLFSDSTKSSGKLLTAIQYQYDIATSKDCTPPKSDHYAFYCGSTCKRLGLSSSSRLAMVTSGGSAVVYPNVTVYEGTNGENGKTEYAYNYVRDTFLYNMTTPVVQSQDWQRGLLTKSVDYQKTGNSYSAVKTVQNTYDARLGQSVNNYLLEAITVKWKLQSQPCVYTQWPNIINYFNFGYYRIASFWYTLTSTTTTQDGVSSTTNYAYNLKGAHANPILNFTTGSDGRTYATKKYYAADLVSIPTHPNYGDTSIFLNQYMIGVPLQEEDYVGTDTAHLGAAKMASRAQYANFNSVANYGQWLPYKSWLMSRDGSWENKFTINAYQSRDLVNKDSLIFPSQLTKQGFPSTYLKWSNNLLDSTTFGGLKKSYTYWSDTKLLNTTTDEFGLTARFTFDGLQRLIKSEGMFTDAGLTTPKSNMMYSYQYGGNAINSETASTTFFDADTTRILTDINYIDGIGRPLQTIKQNYAQDGTHIQTGFITYDAFGRTSQTYLPEKTSVSAYSVLPTSLFYQKMIYEASPLDREVKNVKEDGMAVGINYDKNGTNEVFLLSASSTLTSSYGTPLQVRASSAGYYAAGTLYKITTTDENNHQIIDYKDIFERTVMKRKVSIAGNVDVYYVYDDYGKLASVLPPGSVDGSGNVNQNMIYQYTYDTKNRSTQKKIPGSDWQYFRYDARDLLVLTQDGNLRASGSNTCVATVYDTLGRPIKTGLAYQNLDSYQEGGILTINPGNDLSYTVYYPPTEAVGQRNKVFQSRLKVLGNPTGGGYDASWINKTFQYDIYGRIKTTRENAGTGGFTILDTMNYLFDGKPTSVNRDLQGYWGMDWYSNDQMTYDKSGRAQTTSHQMFRSGGQRGYPNPWSVLVSQQIITANPVYDAQDRIIKKDIGHGSTGFFLQSPTYQYNPRGWLTKINNPTAYDPNNTYTNWNTRLLTTTEPYSNTNHSANPQLAPDSVGYRYNIDLFDEDIHYYDTNSNLSATQAQNNGNISHIIWKVAGREKQAYGYIYDDLDRLTNATYTDMQDANYSAPYTAFTTDNKFGESATYDLRGNIKTLKRRGLQQYGVNNGFAAGIFGAIDDLTYQYADTANLDRLTKVTDATNSSKGFNYAGRSGGNDYSYDKNGNITSDFNKGIGNIIYNYLNLPSAIYLNSGKKIDFLYDAAGNKLKKTVTDSLGNVKYKYYASGVEFDNMYWAPTTFYNSEGRLNFDANANAWYYEYALKDHLGDTRVVFSDKNGDGIINSFTEITQINHYYPFGLNMEGNWNGASGGYKKQYNGKEWNDDFGLNWNDYGARWYDPAVGRWGSVDPLAEKQDQFTPYHYTYNNPVRYNDPDGRCPLCALVGAGVGAVIGGGVEAGIQLYHHGKVDNWTAVGGAALSGAITGGVAGLTGGASLGTTLAVSAATNAVGGAASNALQGKPVTVTSVVTDAAVGGAIGAGGKIVGNAVEKVIVTRQVTQLAKQAQATVTASTGKVAGQKGFGTAAHDELKSLVKASKLKHLGAEESFLGKASAKYGTKGSVRADVVQYGRNGQIKRVFDLKTGSATLTNKQVQNYIKNVPGVSKASQVTEIR